MNDHGRKADTVLHRTYLLCCQHSSEFPLIRFLRHYRADKRPNKHGNFCWEQFPPFIGKDQCSFKWNLLHLNDCHDTNPPYTPRMNESSVTLAPFPGLQRHFEAPPTRHDPAGVEVQRTAFTGRPLPLSDRRASFVSISPTGASMNIHGFIGPPEQIRYRFVMYKLTVPGSDSVLAPCKIEDPLPPSWKATAEQLNYSCVESMSLAAASKIE